MEESFRPWVNEEPLKGFGDLLASFPTDVDQGGRGTFLFSDTFVPKGRG